MARVVDLLKTRAARLVLAAVLTYGASVATTGNWDPSALVKDVMGAFLPGTTPLQGLEDAGFGFAPGAGGSP